MHYPAYHPAISLNGLPAMRSLRGLDHLMGQRSGMTDLDAYVVEHMYPG